MSEETPSKRGEAAWKEQREAVARRNSDAHNRAEGERKQREAAVANAARARVEREAQQLRDLNERIAKQQNTRGG